MKHTVEGVGIVYVTYGQQCLELSGDDKDHSIQSLFESAGADFVWGGDCRAFEFNRDCGIGRYRQRTGRQYPPVYRVKMAIDVEEVSPEETEAFWKARQR